MSDMEEYGMSETEKLPPLPTDMRRYPDMLAASTDAVEINEVVTLELPVADKAEPPTQKLPTRQELRAFVVSSHLPFPTDSISIADQPTWLLPTMPRSARGDNSSTQGYLSLALDMIKSSGIYALGALASPLVSLVLTPFLTHQLSRTDYGGLAVLYTVIDLVTVITQLGLSVAFFRAYNGDYESPRDRSGVLSASVILLVLTSMLVAVAMMLTAPWLSQFLFKSLSFSDPVRFTALVIIVENLTLPGISWLRAEKRAVLYSAFSIANLLLTLSATIVLVGVLHMGTSGALLAKGAGYAVIVVCTLPDMLLLATRRQSLHLRFDIARNLLSFGVPTIFSDIAAWILQVSDRYLLTLFGSLAQTASYTVAYVLGAVLSPVILSPFGLAWIPVMYAIAKREDAPHVFRLVFRWWSLVLLFATFALSLLSTFVLEMLFPPGYHSAEPIIPIIAVSTLFIGIYYMFMIGIYIKRKTMFNILFTAIAAGVNVLLNIFFIPRFGALGAAISTLLAYIMLVVITYIVSQKVYPIRFEIGRFIVGLSVGIVLYVGGSLLAHSQKPPISWCISIGVLILYGIFLLSLGGFSARKLKIIFWYVQKILGQEG